MSAQAKTSKAKTSKAKTSKAKTSKAKTAKKPTKGTKGSKASKSGADASAASSSSSSSGGGASQGHSTISPPGSKRKSYYGQFSVSITPLERMFLEYYADKYGKDRVEVIRGMLRKYVEIDVRFDPDDFASWAGKTFIPAEQDGERREQCQEQLATFRRISKERASKRKARAS